MPWKVSDVESHKKGLTPKQKRQWVEVANSVLSRCLKDGGTDESCAPKAIRQANGVVGKSSADTDLTLVLDAPIAKADDTQQRIFGWASIAVQKDGTPIIDLQGDVIDITDLEEAWYAYVHEAGGMNVEHDGPVVGEIIEAMVFNPEKIAALGLPPESLPQGAWVGFHIPDRADYDLIKSSGHLMFSIEGSAVREAL